MIYYREYCIDVIYWTWTGVVTYDVWDATSTSTTTFFSHDTEKRKGFTSLSLSLSRSLVICWCLDYYDSREGTGTELSVTLERERESLLQLWLGVFTSERGEWECESDGRANEWLHFGYKTQ